MAPTPGRWEAALRITLSCLICTVPVMAFHLQQPLIVMILMFAISKEDTTTTLLGTVLGIIGFTIGCTGLLAFYLCALDLEWLRVLAVPAVITLGLFLNRESQLLGRWEHHQPSISDGMITPDTVSSPEYLPTATRSIFGGREAGTSVNLAVQYLLNPKSSLVPSAVWLAADAVESHASAAGDGETKKRHSPISSFDLVVRREQLRLLKLAGMIEPLLKQRQLNSPRRSF
jgi:hypothetical protein